MVCEWALNTEHDNRNDSKSFEIEQFSTTNDDDESTIACKSPTDRLLDWLQLCCCTAQQSAALHNLERFASDIDMR